MAIISFVPSLVRPEGIRYEGLKRVSHIPRLKTAVLYMGLL